MIVLFPFIHYLGIDGDSSKRYKIMRSKKGITFKVFLINETHHSYYYRRVSRDKRLGSWKLIQSNVLFLLNSTVYLLSVISRLNFIPVIRLNMTTRVTTSVFPGIFRRTFSVRPLFQSHYGNAFLSRFYVNA